MGCLYNGTAAHYSVGLDVCESNIPHNAYYPVIDTQRKLDSLLGLKRSVTVLAYTLLDFIKSINLWRGCFCSLVTSCMVAAKQVFGPSVHLTN